MSLRHLNIAPRASLGFAFIALLVVVLGVFAVNRMTLIREASVAMSANQLPSVTYLGVMTECAAHAHPVLSRTGQPRTDGAAGG